MMRDRTKPDDSEGPLLDPGLGNVLFDVWLVSRAVHAAIDDAIRPAGLDADEFAIYSVLASSQVVTPTELAHWMSAPNTTVSSYIKRFEQRGHVERVPNPDDGRSRRLRLTEAGRQAHRHAGERFAPILGQVEARVASRGPATRRHLDDLRRIVESLRRTTG